MPTRSRTRWSRASSLSSQPRWVAMPLGLSTTTQRSSRWRIIDVSSGEVLAEEVDLDLLAGEVEARIRDHVRRRQGDHLGALRVDVELLDQRERVREVDVVVGDAV